MNRSLCLVGFLLATAVGTAPAQSYLRGWSSSFFDTRAYEQPIVGMDSWGDNLAVIRADGRAFANGTGWGRDAVPPPPTGLRYVTISIHVGRGVGMLSDGSIQGWGGYCPRSGYTNNVRSFALVPALPPGVSYVKAQSGANCALLLRSDGVLIVHGGDPADPTSNPPALPPGVQVVDVDACNACHFVLCSDGQIRSFGYNQSGERNVPALPPGLTYTSIRCGTWHVAAQRSDGSFVLWGENALGQCNLPAPPPGLSIVEVVPGASFTVMKLSDGSLRAFGNNQIGQLNVPVVPAGTQIVRLCAGNHHGVALLSNGTLLFWGFDYYMNGPIPTLPPNQSWLSVGRGGGHVCAVRSDGNIVGWGYSDNGQLAVPALPVGVTYEKVRGGGSFSVALRSDGQLVAWGYNAYGRLNVPALPPGVTYVDFAVGWGHSVAIRSDGQAVAWGYQHTNELNIPALPAGLTYVKARAYNGVTILKRSDGSFLRLGANTSAQPPALPPDVVYTDFSCNEMGRTWSALRSDGQVVLFGPMIYPAGLGPPIWIDVPPLPYGVYYVDLESGYNSMLLRRSDGRIVVCGLIEFESDQVPALEAGESYVEMSAMMENCAARVGPTSTYITYGRGCRGSRGASRLVPTDTPRIGTTFDVQVLDLPQNGAIMVLGWSRQNLPLRSLGLGGCQQLVSIDAVQWIGGHNHLAHWCLPIPDVPALVGVHLYTQAVVLDQAANSVGAVLSDAAEGVIGR